MMPVMALELEATVKIETNCVDLGETSLLTLDGPLSQEQESWIKDAEDWIVLDNEDETNGISLNYPLNELRRIEDVLSSIGRMSSGGSSNGESTTEVYREQLTPELEKVTKSLVQFRRTLELCRKRERESIIRQRRVDGDPTFLGWSSTPLNTSM